VTTPRTETGGPTRTPRSEIAPVIPAARRESVGVEPVMLWDKSGSTDWEAAADGQPWPAATSRRAIMKEVARQIVVHLESLDTEAAAEQAGGSDEMGGILTFFFGSDSSEGVDLNSSNFDRKLAEQELQWGGGTVIMKAWEQALDEYDEEFGDKPERDRPVHAVIILTDGELSDMDEFAKTALSTASAHRVFVVAIFGYDEPGNAPLHTQCLHQYTAVAAKVQAADPHGKQYIYVLSFDSVSDPNEIADDMKTALS
jgi:uncharacterized protein YegL